jgi:hypothetical protein
MAMSDGPDHNLSADEQLTERQRELVGRNARNSDSRDESDA